LGAYEILAAIGAGGMGEVYRGLNVLITRTCYGAKRDRVRGHLVVEVRVALLHSCNGGCRP
jgi:hypothetical protein